MTLKNTPFLNLIKSAILCLLMLACVVSSVNSAQAISLSITPPTLSGSKSGSNVTLYWTIDCSISQVNIQESQDGTTWNNIYSGVGEANDGTSQIMSFGFDGGTFCPGWTSSRILNLPNKTKSGYYFRINACQNSSCSNYGASLLLGTISSGGGDPGSSSLADISAVEDGANSIAYPASNEIVAELKGQERVDGGAFSYTVPLTIAPGRKGIQPSLSLNYSSQSGEGIAGLGWSFSANSSISRCSNIFDLDDRSNNATYSSTDKLCYNGNRLIAVAPPGSGSIGQYGSINTYYKTERNSSVLIKQLGGSINSSSTYFRVYEFNGTYHDLGTNSNSRIIPVGLNVTATWLQQLTQDSHGNQVSYSYDTNTAGNRYLKDIYYTGFEGTLGSRNIHLNYTSTAPERKYHWGGYSVHDRRLASIQVKIDGTVKSTWHLNYSTVPVEAVNDAAKLSSLEYCESSIKSKCVKTDFAWFDRSYNHNLKTTHPLSNINDTEELGLKPRREADYDGDGVDDLVIPRDGIYLSRTGKKVSWGSLPYFSVLQYQGHEIPDLNKISFNTVNGSIDYDLDGADDFVYTDSNSQLVITSFTADGTIKQTYQTGINATCYASIYRDLGSMFCSSQAVDFDGDGRKDLLVATNKQSGSNNYTITYKAYQRRAGGFGFDYRNSFTANANEPLIPMDLDGDGYTDLVPSQFLTNLKWYKGGYNISTKSAFFTEKNLSLNVNIDGTRRSAPSRWADFNGDGLNDILTLDKGSGEFYERHIAFNKGNGQFETPIVVGSVTGRQELAYTYAGKIAKDPIYGGSPGFVYEKYIQFIDYNGDGRQDILYPDANRKKYFYECWDWGVNLSCENVADDNREPFARFYEYDVWGWNVLITNPDGKSFTNKQLEVYGALATMSPIDLTGDGRIDFISGMGYESSATRRTWFYGTKKGGKPSYYPVGFRLYAHDDTQDSVIKSISTGVGVKTKIDYTQLKERYSTPAPTSGYPYINFTNTMRVVSTLESDNGIGGFSKTDYQYKNARYHVAGRGFQGFSDIIETSTDANNTHKTITQTVFEQTFPWSGMVKSKIVKDGSNQTLSSYSVLENYPSSAIYQAGKSWCFYPKESVNEKWTISPNQRITTITSNVTKNENCQITTNTVHSEDATTVHTKSSNQTYSNSVGWQVPLVNNVSQSVTYKTAHSSVALNPTNTTTSQRITNTYSPNEQGVTALTSVKVEGTGTLKGTGSTTSYSAYDQYGNALKTTIGNRYTQVSMTNDGYFVYKTFNAQWPGVATSTNTYDPLTGMVLTSTDIHGVKTTNTVNFLGILISSGSAKGSTIVSPTVYSSMQWLTGNYAYSVTQRSSGKPETITYFDSLNRQVKTVTQGFAGDIISAKEYDARGNLISETAPTQSYGTAEVVRYEDFDVLGRPARKIFDDGLTSYQSDYDYVDGITTDINVSGGLNALMSRSYNSLGQLLSTTDAKGNTSYFAYNAAGLPVLIQDVLGSRITARYDDLGRKAWFDDPNMGKWQFTYNQYGELSTQTDARLLVTTFTYDNIGRQKSQVNTQANRTWVYDTNVGNGKLYQAKVSGHIQTHSYDTAGRIIKTVTAIGSLNFTEKFAYDTQFGRLKAQQFASGEHVAYRFDDNGYLIEDYQLYNNGAEVALRTIDDYSAMGSINAQTFSNGKVQKFFRNSAGAPLSICTSSTGNCTSVGTQYLNYDYDGMGNLQKQENVIAQFKETYNYDELMRVDDSTKTIKGVTYTAVNYDYDAAGNILVKGDYGSNYRYGNTSKSLGGNAGPNALRQFVRGGTTYNFNYDNNGNRLSGDGATLSYDDQNKPLTVVRNGTTSTFSYDANGNRYKQVKKTGSVTTTTYYVGSFEREVTLSSTIDKTYIGDHTIKMKAHIGSLGNQSPFQHVLRDRLGSVDTLVDGNNGFVLQYRGYDVFGRPRDIAAGNNLLASWQGVTKGYTDHEHLNEQQLIHMNGRIYDFNVGRFLSVDPFLQFPENSQSANPYSYILNNPMAGTDPTGYRANIDCSTGSNVGFAGFCSASKELKDDSKKKKPTLEVYNGQQNEQQQTTDEKDWAKTALDTYARITGEKTSTNQNQGASAAATTLAIPLRAAVVGTEVATGDGALGRILTANPILSAIAAMVYSPGLNEGEDEALAQMRSESKLDERKQPPSIVIGETQKRVEAMASLLRQTGVNVETILQDWPRDLLPSNNLEGSLEFNRQWINDKMDKNYTIYDVGLDPTRKNNRSIFYQLELNEINRRGYVNRLGVRFKE